MHSRATAPGAAAESSARQHTLGAAIRRHRVAVLAAIGLLGLGASVAPRLLLGPPVAVDTVTRREFIQSVVSSGHVEAPHRVSIGAQIVGTVKRVPVSEGQLVEAGQVLVELERSEWQAAAAQADVAVRQAEARVRQLREVQVPLAQAALAQAQATLDNSRAQWRRDADLMQQGFIGQAALDDARKALELAEAQWRAAQTQYRTAQPQGSDTAVAMTALAQARASADVAHSRLRYATVTAPAAGTLIARDVEPGDVVQPGKALMVLSPTGATELVVQIDEKNLHLLTVGQHAQASADAYPEQRFAAEVTYINPGIDVQRGSVEVKLAVPKPPAALRQDMTVSVDIQVARHAGALLIPADALHDADGPRPWVLKVDQGRAHRQTLRIGLRGGGLAEVADGLGEGDLIVSASGAELQEGSRLRPVRASATPR